MHTHTPFDIQYMRMNLFEKNGMRERIQNMKQPNAKRKSVSFGAN